MKTFVTPVFLLVASLLLGQDARKELRSGNANYESGDYEKALQHYQQSLEINPNYDKAQFNLGDALYRNNSFTEAASQFEISAEQEFDHQKKAAAYHNLGNAQLSEFMTIAQEQQEVTQNGSEPDNSKMQSAMNSLKRSVDAYKSALRNDPADEDIRYNLAFAKKLLEQMQEQQQNSDQNQDQESKEDQEKKDDQQKQDENKSDQNKDQQDQEQQKDEQGNEKQEPNKPDDNNDGEQEQPAQPQENKLSKEDAAKMLEALQKSEKDIHEKLKLKKQEGKRITIEKDW